MALCYIVSRAIVLQGGWPLFYIEWGWCWWTIIILISTTLWRLVCSFSHCWHSYLRLSDNVLRHRKTTPELWRAKEWWFYKFQFTSRSTHLVGGCSFCILNIAYPTAGFKMIREIHDLPWGAASDLSRWIALLVPKDWQLIVTHFWAGSQLGNVRISVKKANGLRTGYSYS